MSLTRERSAWKHRRAAAMEIRLVSKAVDPFRSPKRTLGDLDAEAAARLITVSSDVALVIDSKGVVRDVAFGSEELLKEGFGEWVGQRWVETVTVESRTKIEEMLSEANTNVSAIAWIRGI